MTGIFARPHERDACALIPERDFARVVAGDAPVVVDSNHH